MKNLKSKPLNGFSSRSSFMASCAWTGLPPQYSPSDMARGTDPFTYGHAWTMLMALTPSLPDGCPSSPMPPLPLGEDPAHQRGWIMNADNGWGEKPAEPLSLPSSSPPPSSPAAMGSAVWNRLGGRSPIKFPVRRFMSTAWHPFTSSRSTRSTTGRRSARRSGPRSGDGGNVIPNLARRAGLMLLVDLYCEVGKGSSKRPPKKELPFPFLSTLSASDRSVQNLTGLAISTSPPSNRSSKSVVPPLPDDDASSSSSSTGLAQFSSSHVPPTPAAPPAAAVPPSFDDSSFAFSRALAWANPMRSSMLERVFPSRSGRAEPLSASP
mmetsp:Transcript_1270/g.3161  ORF Transcript_1270/g.3161 Transcript_1270/m.3161 type:complete len:323 (-) Transcript_1270:588-1556(-)